MSDLVESFSGIRGIYGKGLTDELAQKYARAYCSLFQKKIKLLVIGGDSRASTLKLKKAMLKIFPVWGVRKIIDIGVAPIQVSQFAVLKFKAQGGVYITASHNEPEYNGWKFLKEDGSLLQPEQVEKLIKIVKKTQRQETITQKLNPAGKDEDVGFLPGQAGFSKEVKIIKKNKEAIENYLNFILKKVGKSSVKKIRNSKFKILVDPNGGSALVLTKKLFNKLGARTKIINNKLGKFARPIEPNSKSLTGLIKKVKEGKFDFGCGFDCDADRVEFVLSKSDNSQFTKEMGLFLSGNYVLALCCDAYLKGSEKQVVVVNDCTSYLIRDVIKKYRAKIKEVEVGEVNLVREMEKQKCLIGGEGSNGGVIIFPIKCRDGIMSIVLILKMLAERKKSLTDILEKYPRYYSERVKMKCAFHQSLGMKNKLERYFKGNGYKIKKSGGAGGGLKILFKPNSFLWFRQSKTEPGIFRIIADGSNKKEVKDLLKQGVKLFRGFKK